MCDMYVCLLTVCEYYKETDVVSINDTDLFIIFFINASNHEYRYDNMSVMCINFSY